MTSSSFAEGKYSGLGRARNKKQNGKGRHKTIKNALFKFELSF